MDNGLLKQRPLRLCDYEERQDNLIRVVIPRFRNTRLGSFLSWLMIPRDQKLNLDEFGSFVYLACDGKHTVQEIAERLRERFGDRVEPLEERLGLFLRELFRRDLITFLRHE